MRPQLDAFARWLAAIWAFIEPHVRTSKQRLYVALSVVLAALILSGLVGCTGSQVRKAGVFVNCVASKLPTAIADCTVRVYGQTDGGVPATPVRPVNPAPKKPSPRPDGR